MSTNCYCRYFLLKHLVLFTFLFLGLVFMTTNDERRNPILVQLFLTCHNQTKWLENLKKYFISLYFNTNKMVIKDVPKKKQERTKHLFLVVRTIALVVIVIFFILPPENALPRTFAGILSKDCIGRNLIRGPIQSMVAWSYVEGSLRLGTRSTTTFVSFAN